MRSYRSLLAACLAYGMASCADTPPSTPTEPGVAAAAAREPANPTALWEFSGTLSDGTTAGITGDGRDASGFSTAVGNTGAYQDGQCGVMTQIFVYKSQSGDATIDPDRDYNNGLKCAKRYFNFAVGSGVQYSAFANAKAVWYLASVGDWKLDVMGWNTVLDCAKLQFQNVRYRREADTPTGKRVWTVETTDHNGVCLVWSQSERHLVPSGVTYYLPYSIRITEI